MTDSLVDAEHADTMRTPVSPPTAGADDHTVMVYTHPDQFPDSVRALFGVAEVDTVESGVTWYRNLVDAVYAGHPGVRFFVLHRAGHPIAALPIVVEKGRFARRVLALANYYTALYSPVLAGGVTSEDIALLLREICHSQAPVESLRFAPMATEGPAYMLLSEALRLSGLPSFPFYCFGNWFQPVNVTWAEYLAEREGLVRSTIKRMGKKFAAAGGSLQIIEGGSDLEKGLQAYQNVYAASWKVPEPYTEFIPGLIRACAERGWLRLGVAWLADKPIAAQLWIIAHRKAYIYKLAYHEEFKSLAPGTLLTAMLTQHAMEQDGVSEIDYLIGDDSYKKSWMSSRRERWGLMAYNPRTVMGLCGWCNEYAGRRLKPLVSRFRKTVTVKGGKSNDSTRT